MLVFVTNVSGCDSECTQVAALRRNPFGQVSPTARFIPKQASCPGGETGRSGGAWGAELGPGDAQVQRLRVLTEGFCTPAPRGHVQPRAGRAVGPPTRHSCCGLTGACPVLARLCREPRTVGAVTCAPASSSQLRRGLRRYPVVLRLLRCSRPHRDVTAAPRRRSGCPCPRVSDCERCFAPFSSCELSLCRGGGPGSGRAGSERARARRCAHLLLRQERPSPDGPGRIFSPPDSSAQAAARLMGSSGRRGSVSWRGRCRLIQGLSVTCFLEVKGSMPPLVFRGDRFPSPCCSGGVGADACPAAGAAFAACRQKRRRWACLKWALLPDLTHLVLREGQEVSPRFQLHLKQ
ncbi:uncharacterized protein ACIBXB_019467 [Morphnus guianensis]